MDLGLIFEKAKMVVVPFAITVWLLINKYKSIASWIALRIEKDTKDGDWAHAEKEKMAIDLYFEKIKPNLPVYLWVLKLVPSIFVKPIILWLVRKICKKTHKIKKLPKK